MKNLILWLLPVLVCSAAALIISCSGDDDDNDDNEDIGVADDDSGDGCTIEQLCQKGVECEGWVDVNECLTEWDGVMDECTDFDGLIACNCDCLSQFTDCDPLMDCGVQCTLEYCL